MQHVGDVAVCEDLARVGAEEGGFGTARVGTAEEEERRGLALGTGGEDVGVFVGEGFAPGGVGLEEGGERI